MLVKEVKQAQWGREGQRVTPTDPAMRTNGSRQVLMSWPLTPLHTSDQKPFVFHAERHATLITRTANRLGQTQSVSRT